MDRETASLSNTREGDDEIVRVDNVTKTLGGKRVLDGVSFSVRRGERLVIMGGSGTGKTTLLHIIVGIKKPDSGDVYLFGRNIVKLSDGEMDKIRRRFGILFQFGALFGSMSVGENIALPMKEHTDLAGSVIDIMVKVKLALVGLSGYEDGWPASLSGGQIKRVALARAIALDPQILFYDEPTSGLDPVTVANVDDLIIKMSRQLHVTTIVVTHDMASAMKIADNIIMLHAGDIVARGTPDEIKNSDNPAVQQFIKGEVEGPIKLQGGQDLGGSVFDYVPSARRRQSQPWWRPW